MSSCNVENLRGSPLVMRIAVVVALVTACASRHSLSPDERRELDELRRADREAVEAGATSVRQLEHRITDNWDAERRAREAASRWGAATARLAKRKLGNTEVDTLLHRYLEERALAWSDLNRALGFGEDEATHMIAYREHDELARATAAELDAALAKLELPPLPASPPDAAVVLQSPPPAAPGSAIFLAGDKLVVLDDTGFHVVASEIGQLDVSPNGTAWGCGTWRAVRWDGKTALEVKTKIYNQQCATGPDGKLWVLDNDLDHHGKDRIASFDGKQWTVVSGTIGDPYQDTEQLIVASGDIVYAVEHSSGGFDSALFVLEKGKWREVPRASPSHSIEHLFVGADGNAWIIQQVTNGNDYPDALAQVAPDGIKPPTWIDDHFQTSFLWATVSADGVPVIFDSRRNVIFQGKQALRLPMPNIRSSAYRRPGGFAYDAAGRTWIELDDGLSILERDGTRHVFPRGSVPALREPISAVYVVGAGPTLPPVPAVDKRTITATLSQQGTPVTNANIVMCANPWTSAPPCAKGVPQWTARTDANGRFTLEGVPRFRYELVVEVGPRGDRHWRSLSGKCCDGDATDVSFGIAPGPLY